MPKELPADIWFVRSNGGSGSYPVTPEGWRVARNFGIGMAASTIVGVALALSQVGPAWLWPVVFVAGVVASGWYFIDTARKHTDTSLTYNEYVKDKTNA